jgi:hypothetical protein
LDFGWDSAKAKADRKKHGVSFSAAARVFDDTHRVEWLDTREVRSEELFVTVGEVNGQVLAVVYTMRRERVRIISARRASRTEKDEYHGDRSH